MTTFSRNGVRRACAILAAAVLSVLGPASALAQGADDPNPGALTFAGGVDVPTLHFLRGIRQEADPALTMWPLGDIELSLFSGDGGVKSVGVRVGVWNSLQTGSSGSDGPSGRLHYREDFYATLVLGFGGGLSLGTTFTAYTSPNAMFNTVKEISFKVSQGSRFAPYGLLAVELGGDGTGQADRGANTGTYLELGIGPGVELAEGKASLAIPVKVGLSVSDYYEHPAGTGDEKFGFFDIGGIITLPLTGIPSRFGSWNIHGGADVLVFGKATEAINVDKDGETSKNKVVALFGIGVSY